MDKTERSARSGAAELRDSDFVSGVCDGVSCGPGRIPEIAGVFWNGERTGADAFENDVSGRARFFPGIGTVGFAAGGSGQPPARRFCATDNGAERTGTRGARTSDRESTRTRRALGRWKSKIVFDSQSAGIPAATCGDVCKR